MTNKISSQALASHIEKLICVSKPYYALEQLQLCNDDTLQAEINVQNLTHGEATLISGSEAGRHLAILGSCALALQNPIDSKHYYLANQAYITRGELDDQIICCDALTSRTLILQANVIVLDLAKKQGKVETKIMTQKGEIIFNLEVNYQVLKAELFQKLFKKGFVESAKIGSANPYTKTVDIAITSYSEQILTGDLGVIAAEQCVGHFDHYPALPIAILSGALSKLAGMHLKNLFKNKHLKFALKRSSLSASRLAFAGEHVFVHSTFISGKQGEYTFYVKAYNAQSEVLGDIEITFDLMQSAEQSVSEIMHYIPMNQHASNAYVAF